jgi:imidazolonepropionase-like amidohydrolase
LRNSEPFNPPENLNMTSERLIKPWTPRKQQNYAFQNVSIVDVASGTILSNRTVKTSNGFIESIHSNESEYVVVPSTNDIIVDLKGKYLCPGLFDNHVHLAAVPGEADLGSLYALDTNIVHMRQAYVCQEMLRRGFTSVRDCGGATLALKEAINDGVIQGPRLFIAGHALSQTGGHGDTRGPHTHSECCGSALMALGRICDGVPECIKAAREELRTGADFIKIMAGGGVASPTDKLENVQFTGEEVRAISEVARNANTYVTAHAYTPRSIRHAIDNGATGIEHGNLIDASTARYMALKDCFLTPTLITYATMASDEFPGFLPVEGEAKNEAVLRAGIASLKIASEAGVTICFGTDLLGPLGVAQSREFGLRAQALSAGDILRSATINPARRAGLEGFLGQVKEGFAADLLILNGNPLEDVGMLDEPEKTVLAVIKEGRVFHSRWSRLEQDVLPSSSNIE